MENTEKDSSELKRRFMNEYKPLLMQFLEEIKDVNFENLPVPFIPVHGKEYANSKYKIAFVGWETRDNSGLAEYIRDAEKDPIEALYNFSEVIDEENGFNFTKYGNSFGTGFWDFVMKFLAAFHGISDWKEIKEIKHADILKSFVWGNIDSIERYEVTAKEKGGNYQNWLKLKDASKIFDTAYHMLNVFNPDIVIVLKWIEDDGWLRNGIMEGFEEKSILNDILDYYHIKDTDTLVYWTHHPRSLSAIKIEEIIFEILNDLKSKEKYKDFPGIKLIETYNKRSLLFEKLKVQLKEAAQKVGIETEGNDWGNGGESYFKFKLPKTKTETIICFGFDKGYDKFSIGVEIGKKGENYSLLKQQVGSTLSTSLGKDANYPNWAYLHYYDNDLRSWNLDNKIWDGIEDNKTCDLLMGIIEKMIKALNEIPI